MEYLFVEVGVVMVIAGILAILAYKLRQPLIIAYILTGVLVGPGVMNLVQSTDVLGGLSKFGIALLLFIVGLNLNWRSIRDVGPVVLIGGICQVIITSAIGYGITTALGFDTTTSLFLGLAFSFSSTIIIVKLLSDKDDLDRLYGRISVGMLIVQDMMAMFALLMLGAWHDGGSISQIVTTSLVKGVLVVVALFLLSKTVLPLLFKFVARSQELLFLVALGWCFAVASILLNIGFSIEIGALLAGISLAASGFQHEIEAKIRTLRDFFLIIFFIVLGTGLTLGSLQALLLPAVVISLYILVGNPLIAWLLMRLLGYHPRTAFLTGTTMAQISEFSFILLTAGIAAGLVTQSSLALATIVALITITLSSYFIAYNEQLYEHFSVVLERFGLGKHIDKRSAEVADYILFGYSRSGRRLWPQLKKMTGTSLVVDYNPVVIEELASAGIAAMYGDAGSDDLLHFIGVARAKLIISTIPDILVTIDLLDYLRTHHAHGTIIVTVKNAEEAARCYKLGATYAVIPSVLGGEHLGQYLKEKKIAKSGWRKLAKQQKAA